MAGPLALEQARDGWSRLKALLRTGLDGGVATAISLVVGQAGRVIFEQALGWTTDHAHGQAVGPESLFDLASLTKPLATTLACLGLVQSGDLELKAPLGQWLDLPPDKASLTPAHLLAHASGLPAWRPYYQELIKLPPASRPKRLLDLVVAEPLESSPGQQRKYSDLGFMLLKALVERITDSSLAEYLAWSFYEPLGLGKELGFVVLPEGPGPIRERFVATEHCPWRGKLLQGEVNDDNAWAEGGIAGQAGLFGTARAVFRLMDFIAASAKGQAKVQLLSPAVAGLIHQRPFAGLTSRLGFDSAEAEDSSAGRLARPGVIGHLGFVGTSLWHDPARDLTVVLLSNRTIFGRKNLRHIAFRREVHDLVADIFSGRPMPAIGSLAS